MIWVVLSLSPAIVSIKLKSESTYCTEYYALESTCLQLISYKYRLSLGFIVLLLAEKNHCAREFDRLPVALVIKFLRVPNISCLTFTAAFLSAFHDEFSSRLPIPQHRVLIPYSALQT
jgi:hypothetical protein